jgi:hypothetical protein
MMAAKQPKPITVIAPYALKDRETKRLTGTICYSIRSSNGSDTYCVRLQPGRPPTCNCPARTYRPGKSCSHILAMERRERERQEQRRLSGPLNGNREFGILKKAC